MKNTVFEDAVVDFRRGLAYLRSARDAEADGRRERAAAFRIKAQRAFMHAEPDRENLSSLENQSKNTANKNL